MSLSILDALDDPALFGEAFAEPSWRPWRAFLGALFGLPLDDDPASSRAPVRAAQTPWRPVPIARPGWSAAGAAASRGSWRWSRSISPAS